MKTKWETFNENREKSVPVQIYQGKKGPSDSGAQYFDLKSAEKAQDSTFSVDKNEKSTRLIRGKYNL